MFLGFLRPGLPAHVHPAVSAAAGSSSYSSAAAVRSSVYADVSIRIIMHFIIVLSQLPASVHAVRQLLRLQPVLVQQQRESLQISPISHHIAAHCIIPELVQVQPQIILVQAQPQAQCAPQCMPS